MLLLGLILCCGSAVVHALKPNVIVCSVARIASGTSYAIVYATLLVKLVFLVSLNGGVYLPATYQSLLLCFAILIQVVKIGLGMFFGHLSYNIDILLCSGRKQHSSKVVAMETKKSGC